MSTGCGGYDKENFWVVHRHWRSFCVLLSDYLTHLYQRYMYNCKNIVTLSGARSNIFSSRENLVNLFPEIVTSFEFFTESARNVSPKKSRSVFALNREQSVNRENSQTFHGTSTVVFMSQYRSLHMKVIGRRVTRCIRLKANLIWVLSRESLSSGFSTR